MFFFPKRFAKDGVTRTWHACNTYVKRMEHERATSVTRTCHGKCDKKF